MEFRKGILFIRLAGTLSKNTVYKLDEEVTDLVKENGIRNIVFNMEQLENIDKNGIYSLLENYQLSKKYRGDTLICNIKNSHVYQSMKENRLFRYMYEISDELSAIKKINI